MLILRELSTDWLPWRYQVAVFGCDRKHGYTDRKFIVTDTSNHETRTEAETAHCVALERYKIELATAKAALRPRRP